MGRIELPVDLREVESGFPLIEPGVYNATVEKCTEELAKSGEKKAMVICSVLDGTAAGKKFVVNLSLQHQALWKLRQFMEVIGVAAEGAFFDPDAFIGRRFRAAIGNKPVASEDGTTKTFTNVDDFLPYVSA
jgi:hypothetical protein